MTETTKKRLTREDVKTLSPAMGRALRVFIDFTKRRKAEGDKTGEFDSAGTCSRSTMQALQRRGLVEYIRTDSQDPHWGFNNTNRIQYSPVWKLAFDVTG